jgi:GGDEF domain-containing protein
MTDSLSKILSVAPQDGQLLKVRSELSQARGCLQVTMEQMAAGASMFDRDRRLVMCNRRYMEMYGLPPAMTRPGTMLSKILEFCQVVALGGDDEAGEPLEGRRAEWEMAPVGRHPPTQRRQTLPGGRVIRVTFHPLEDGGWVDIHEDVTEGDSGELERALDHRPGSPPLLGREPFLAGVNAALSSSTADETGALYVVEVGAYRTALHSLGLAVRDRLLAELAGTLKDFVRRNDLVARLDGDLFGVFLAQFPRGRELAGFAGRLLAALDAERELGGRRFSARIGLGVAMAPEDGGDARLLLDVALKRLGA